MAVSAAAADDILVSLKLNWVRLKVVVYDGDVVDGGDDDDFLAVLMSPAQASVILDYVAQENQNVALVRRPDVVVLLLLPQQL